MYVCMYEQRRSAAGSNGFESSGYSQERRNILVQPGLADIYEGCSHA